MNKILTDVRHRNKFYRFGEKKTEIEPRRQRKKERKGDGTIKTRHLGQPTRVRAWRRTTFFTASFFYKVV